MIHRLAMFIGGLTAVAILAFSVVRGERTTAGATAADPATPAATDITTEAPVREVVDTVYVAAPKRAKVVHVTRRVPRPRADTPTATKRPRRQADQDREHERDEKEHEDREHEHGGEHEEDD